MPTTLKEVIEFVRCCSKEDRREVSETLRYLFEDENAQIKAELRVGDRVSFTPKKRGWPQVVVGTVVAKRVKRVEVRLDEGGRHWVVTPSLLKKL